MRNPFRKRWVVQKYRPFTHGESLILRYAGPSVHEEPPAPVRRAFWTLKQATFERDRLNAGMQALQARERFRVIETR